MDVRAGQGGCGWGCEAIWGADRRPVNLVTVVPCASDRGRWSLTGACGIRLSTILERFRTPDAYLHPEAGRDHAHLARDRRDRRRARPPREPDRDPAARQAQGDLRPPRRRGRLRHHHQRRQGRPHRRQAAAEEGLPPLRLPGWPQGDLLHRAARQEPGEGHREGSARHAAPHHPRQGPAEQAQGLPRHRAPPRCPAAQALRDHPGGPVMTENVQIDETAGTDVNDALVTEYTSESDGAVAGEPVQRPRATAPGAATGRRKQAVARVRIVPGTGEWTINGRTLQGYFPNKVHQQIVNEPLSLLELDGAYDVLVRVHGGGPSGQAGAVRLGVARSLNGIDEELNRPALKKAGFLSRDARFPERKKAGLKKARKAPQYSKR